jgi:hypothetical protein
MTSLALNIDPWVAGLAILVVIVTEIACRVAEAGALVDAAINDTTVGDDQWWADWTAENQRKLDRLNGQNQ